MPRIITPEESSKYQKKVTGRTTLVRSLMMQLEMGQEMIVTKEEWKWKRVGPNHLCRYLEKRTQLKFECYRILNAQGGWIIKRIK